MRGPTFFASLQPGRDRHEQFFPHLRFAPYFVALPIPLALPTLDDVDDQTVGHLFETWALAHVFALHEDPESFQRGFLGGVGQANHFESATKNNRTFRSNVLFLADDFYGRAVGLV